MYSKILFKLITAIIFAVSGATIHAQFVCVGKGLGFEMWLNSSWENYPEVSVSFYHGVIVGQPVTKWPTVDVRNGAPLIVEDEDIVRGIDPMTGQDTSLVAISFSNFQFQHYVYDVVRNGNIIGTMPPLEWIASDSHVNGRIVENPPYWLPEGVWGYRVRFKSSRSLVPNEWGGFMDYPWDGQSPRIDYCLSHISLRLLSEKNVYYELLDQAGNVIGRFDVVIEGDCGSCKTLTCQSNSKLGSIDYSIPVGLADPVGGLAAQMVKLDFYQSQTVTIDPKAIRLVAPSNNSSVQPTYGSGGQLESVRAGTSFAKIEPFGGGADPTGLKVTVSSDYLNPATSVIRTVLISRKLNEDQEAYLEFDEQLGGVSSITSYLKRGADTWIMETGSGLRRETRSIVETPTLRTKRTTIEERVAFAPLQYASVSDELTQYESSSYGWQEVAHVLDPDQAALTTTTSYYGPTEDSSLDGSGSVEGAGRIKQVIHPTGESEIHYYFKYPEGDFFDSGHVVKRAFAGMQQGREISTDYFSGLSPATGLPLTISRITERLSGEIVSKKEASHESRMDGLFSEERVYSSATAYTSTYSFKGFDGSLSVVNSDGTASISNQTTDGQSTFTTAKSITGYVVNDPANGNALIQAVTLSESITDKYGEEVAYNVYRYQGGEQVLLSRKLATDFDGNHRATRFEHFVEGNGSPIFITEKEYACCGIARERDESGVDTFFAYDELHRVKATNRNNVTTETQRLGLTTSTYRYPQIVLPGSYLSTSGNASVSNEISRSVSNLAGDVVSEWSPSAQDGAMVETSMVTTYNVGGGIGRRVVTHPPITADDGAAQPEQIEESNLDGSPSATTGNLSPNRIFQYTANNLGLVVQSSFLDGTVERETTTTQQDWANQQVKVIYASDADGVGGNDFSSSAYNSKGQLVRTTDPDGLTTLYAYNARGEQTLTATDLNGNQVIDMAVDQVSSSETDLAIRSSGEWVMRTSQKVWMDNASDIGTVVNYSDVSLDGLKRWNLANPTLQSKESSSVTTLGAAGVRSELSTRSDGSSKTTVSTKGLVSTITSRDANGVLSYQIDSAYDSLNRPFTVTDSRTGTSTRHYVSSNVDVVNRTVDELTRETLYTYDHRGRAKTTNLPDTLNESGGTVSNVTETFYFPSGSVREQSGDGVYQTTQSYDYADRVSTMTTYGTQTAVTRWNYDPNRGFLVSKLYNSPTANSGQGPSYTYTAAGRLKSRTQARLVSGAPLVTSYTYGTSTRGNAGILDQVSHSDGTPAYTVSTRDRIGRPLVLIDAVAGTRNFTYTRHGALEDVTIAGTGILAGQKLGADFDSRLRPRSHSASFAAQTLGTATYGYGPSGAIQSVSGLGFKAEYFYHAQKRTLETVSYTKDGDTTPLLQSLRKYDSANRLTRITAHVNDTGVQKPMDHHGYDYDALDRIDSHADMTGAAWTYGYNAKGEVGKAVKKLPGGTTEVNGRGYRYYFDGIGNRTLVEQSRDSGQPVRSFGYTLDALNQYSAITHPSFIEIAGSAAPAATVTVNAASVTRQDGYFRKELSEDNSSGPQWIDASVTDATTITDGSLALPAASVTPQHDEDGNLKSDGLWNYTWDAENRLIRCERAAVLVSAGAPYLKLQYDYDSQSRRIRTSTFTSGGASSPASQTIFIFDGWKCVAELNVLSGNQPIRKYTWGLDLAGDIGDSTTGNVGALLWLVDTASNKTHVHLYDKNGNVSGLVDASTRKRSATYDYDPFGQLTVCYGAYSKSNPFTFSTKHTDFATGLCFYGYRWYDPRTGRWPSRDPIEEKGGVNLYGFIGNDGVNRWDKLGLKCCKKDIEDQLFELNRRYWGATQRFAANGVCPGGKGMRSCKNTSFAVLSALEPIPKCWTCSLERRRKPWYKGGFDHQVITCVAHPDSSDSGYNPEPVVFDFWGGNDVSAPHDDFVDDYPVPLVPEDPKTGTSENDHSPEINKIIRDHPYDTIDSIPPTPRPINLP